MNQLYWTSVGSTETDSTKKFNVAYLEDSKSKGPLITILFIKSYLLGMSRVTLAPFIADFKYALCS